MDPVIRITNYIQQTIRSPRMVSIATHGLDRLNNLNTMVPSEKFSITSIIQLSELLQLTGAIRWVHFGQLRMFMINVSNIATAQMRLQMRSGSHGTDSENKPIGKRTRLSELRFQNMT